MGIAAIDWIEPVPAFEALPISFSQRPSRLPALGLLLICVPALALLLLPFGLVAALATESPAALAMIAERPTAAIQLALGSLVALGFLVWPVRRLFGHLRSGRDVEIVAGRVDVRERGFFATTQWSAPLASYCGVAGHIRASLSGTRHEIILVHPATEKSILLHFSDRPGHIRADRVAALLGLPEISAGELYRRRPVGGQALLTRV